MAEAARLHYWDAFWDLSVEDCPCDVHFVAWLDANRVADSAIYHFGTGNHHHVGIECAKPARRNSVLGITASPQEHESFVQLVMRRPEVLRFYNVVFGDIYLANPRLLPTFDVVTLFHLCEYRGKRADSEGATDLEVTHLFTDRTRPGGHILFYPGSFAFDNAREVIAEWEKARDVERVGAFETLLVYRKRG